MAGLDYGCRGFSWISYVGVFELNGGCEDVKINVAVDVVKTTVRNNNDD